MFAASQFRDRTSKPPKLRGYSASFGTETDIAGNSGGEGGIRTHETVTRLHAFQACAFDHSATSPAQARETSERVGTVKLNSPLSCVPFTGVDFGREKLAQGSLENQITS